MKESLVQWTLLQNLDFLSKSLDFSIAKKIGQEISTDYGRIDFVLEDSSNKQLIVELETILDAKNKRDYCFEQTKRYKNVKYSPNTKYCLLYAEETNSKYQKEIDDFGKREIVDIKKYSLEKVKQLYTRTVDRLSLSFGLSLPKPADYTICYLRWLNKILKPYKDFGSECLQRKDFDGYFNKTKDDTNFRCYKQLALDFEMIMEKDGFVITNDGKGYIDNFNLNVEDVKKKNLSSVDMTNEQKKILLRIITNGNWTNHKVNIYWFLRFMEITNGEWIPNKTKFDKKKKEEWDKYFEPQKLKLVNGLFCTSHIEQTMSQFLNFACNWCIELGLVERIKTNLNYDSLSLTPLGIEINNIFSLDLLLKKSRLNLNFKYLD